MARRPDTPDCSIKGCVRARYRGYLCKKHHSIVTLDMSMASYMAGLHAQMKAVDAWRKKQLAYVRQEIAEGRAE